MQQDRLGHRYVVADVLQYGHEVLEVMRVHRTHVVEAQLLKQSATGCDASHIGVYALVHFL